MSSSALEAFKAKLEIESTPTPLWVYLYIYEKANRECYIEKMEGARSLAAFLSPIEIPKFPDTCKVPEVLGSYETQELETILGCSQDTIILSTITELIPRL